MKDIQDRLKSLLENALPFIKEHKRYVGAGILLVCFLCVLVFFTGPEFNSDRIAKQNGIEISGDEYEPDAEFEVDAYPELNELIEAYFKAYVNGDFVVLEEVAYPLTEMEQSYITTMSQFYEAYENITCYTKHGLSKDSYIVAARFDIRFAGQEETAPSMMLFYVQTNEEGGLYINNLYSDFNMQYSENAISKDVYTALRKFTTQEDYLELYNEVEAAFTNLIKENTDIYQLTKRTIPGTRQMWEDTVFYVQSTEGVDSTESTETAESTEAESQTDTTDTTEETPADVPEEIPADTQEETPDESDEPQTEKIKMNAVVRVRDGAGTSYDIIGETEDGEVFVKLGVKEDSNGDEWTKIQYTDSVAGYVKSTYVESAE